MAKEKKIFIVDSQYKFNHNSNHVNDINSSKYNEFIKMQLIGNFGVGKSCLLSRYTEDIYIESKIPSSVSDYKLKRLKIDNKNIPTQVWEQERFPQDFSS